MNNQVYFNRIEELRQLIKNKDEAILITNEINVGYFSGFQHSEGVMLVTDCESCLLVDFRYIEAAKKYSDNCTVICFTRLIEDLSGLLKKYSIKHLYLESSDVNLARYSAFKKSFDEIEVECIVSDELDLKISDIRIIKDENEYKKILRAQQITEEAYLEILNFLKPGVAERKIAVELEYLIKQKGAEKISFDLITITGKKTSFPHGVPSDDVICAGDFFTMDIGSVYDGYHSDTTRTVAIKSASEEMKKIYNIVLNAQLAALKKIKDGVLCSEIDAAARNIIENEGYGEYFGHSTGHGVGLEIHEAPAVSRKNDTVLREGMIITDEPGIYIPNKFGVRIEDMVYVTKNGCKNFVTLPKELIIV